MAVENLCLPMWKKRGNSPLEKC